RLRWARGERKLRRRRSDRGAVFAADRADIPAALASPMAQHGMGYLCAARNQHPCGVVRTALVGRKQLRQQSAVVLRALDRDGGSGGIVDPARAVSDIDIGGQIGPAVDRIGNRLNNIGAVVRRHVLLHVLLQVLLNDLQHVGVVAAVAPQARQVLRVPTMMAMMLKAVLVMMVARNMRVPMMMVTTMRMPAVVGKSGPAIF